MHYFIRIEPHAVYLASCELDEGVARLVRAHTPPAHPHVFSGRPGRAARGAPERRSWMKTMERYERIRGMTRSCTCNKCQAACTNKPGWFLPGEAEKVAAHLGTTLDELFTTKLGVDWYEGDAPVFVLSPAITSMSAGETFPSDPMGQCVFFVDGRCSIHKVKPFECRAFLHGQSFDETNARHEQVAEAWRDHQQQIEDVLGREAEAVEGSLFDLLSMFGLA